MYQIIQNDIIKWAKNYTGPKFHCIFADPPYHLVSINKRFSKPNSAPAKGDVYRRASAGFMGCDWDSVDETGKGIAFNPETWAALAEHLYPGAFIMSFASSRGWHRMAVAMEDAGLIIHPSIWMYWSYLSGFPKATRIKGHKEFDGHRYGGQCLKPAVEPIIVAQVPYSGRPVDSIVATGAGALWIDGGRIAIDEDLPSYRVPGVAASGVTYQLGATPKGNHPDSIRHNVNGRWPANFLLSHTELCQPDACHPDCPVRLLDSQSGNRPAGGSRTGNEPSDKTSSVWGDYASNNSWDSYNDSGPASRIFYRADFAYEVAEQLANAEPVKYEPKSSSREREAGLDSLETRTRHRVNAGGLENEPRFAPTQVKNNHPTLKPLSLTKYLSALLAPPAAYAPRRILIPFSGSGSEIIGAILSQQWENIVGIERESNYVKISEARCKWWSQWPGWGQTDVDAILKADEGSEKQLSFLEPAA